MKVRNNSRAFILNENNEILLQKRELYEELGLKIDVEDESILALDIPFNGKNGKFISHEVYYLIRLPKNTVFSLNNMEEGEKNAFHNIRWWNLDELKETKEEFEPKDQILDLLTSQENG